MRTIYNRNSLMNWAVIVALIVGASAIFFTPQAIRAQSSKPQALDLMLLIDNSCSMFAPNTPGCVANTPGTDLKMLRVRGAQLFAARLASGQLQPKDRIGAISFGADLATLYPLTRITELVRNDLAIKVDSPKPRGGTQVVNALKAAYAQLLDGSSSGNRPAIVFLTDGRPEPDEGQSFTKDIEPLITDGKYRQIPIYVLLLQNQSEDEREYREYIQKWRDLQSRVNHIKVYEVKDAEQLLEIHNNVTNDLSAQPYSPPPVYLDAGQSREFYVSRFASKVIVTVVHPDKNNRGQVEITDKSGQVLKAGEDGVYIFNQYTNGPDNPIEVYSARGVRLKGQTGGNWRIKAVGVAFSFFVDVGGAYEFQWQSPAASPAPLPGVLVLDQAVRPTDSVNLQFRLVGQDGIPISDRQQIKGEVKTPDGQTLPIFESVTFSDNLGLYTLPFQASAYRSAEGWYEIKLQSEDPQQPADASGTTSVIAEQTVRVNIDRNASALVTPVSIPPTDIPPTVLASTSMPAPTVIAPKLTPTPQLVCPGDPGCPPPPSPLPLIILGVVGLLVGGYILLRFLKKSPEGFVAVVDGGQVGSPRSLKGMAQGKPWKWWEVTVGLKGDLRVRPALPTEGGANNAEDQAPMQQEYVTLPDGRRIPANAPARRGGQQQPRRQHQVARRPPQKEVVAKFVRDGDSTQFVKLDPRSTRTLKDAKDTVTIGNIELRIGLKKENLI